MIFVEGDTDKLLFDALVRYYRQLYGAGIASCEVRNLHGVSRYMSKVSGKLRNQIIPAAEKKGMEVRAVCCSYDTDVFEYAERPVVDWNRVEAEVKRMGIRNFCQVKVEQMIEDWLLDDREHPLDVLHKCDSETLMYISQMIKMGKGSNISFGEPFVRGRQIQRMNLVLTYDNMDDPSNCR